MALELGKLDALMAKREAAVTKWAAEVGVDLLGRAQREAPIDVGELRASGYATVEKEGDTISAVVGFNQVYAAEQHERTDFKHPKGGKAKYLADPVKEMSDTYRYELARSLR